MTAWILPDQISDLLPPEAAVFERLRRRLIDLYSGYGYQLFMPPLVEYAESLRVTGAHDLERRSFKLTDAASGRLLGLRADITPQAARVDAHLLGESGLSRLCYAGPVVHAEAASLLAHREPFQVGCELFGHAGLEADLEIQELALASLDAAGLASVHLDLTDRSIFLALRAQDSGLARHEDRVLDALRWKDRTALRSLSAGLAPETLRLCEALMTLYGPATGAGGVIERARAALPQTDAIAAAIDRLEAVAQSALFVRHPSCQLTIDLADLAGWRYHNGIMFSIHCPGVPDAVVRGGRYDGVGEAFGRARPATGFSLELRSLAALAVQSGQAQANPAPVAAPWQDDASLQEAITALRQQGRVVVQLPSAGLETWSGPCLKRVSGQWALVDI